MSSKSEYQKIRDNILRQARKYQNQGYKVPYIPRTPLQAGMSAENIDYDYFIEEMQSFKKEMQLSVEFQRRIKTGRSYARYNDVVISNFRKSLQSKKYAEGASIVEKWFNNVVQRIGEDAMAEVLEEAQNSGVEVDRYVKYGKDTYALNYIGDMTTILNNKGLLDAEAVEEVLTDASYINEANEGFFDDFIQGVYDDED